MILTAPAESFADVREIPLDELVPFAQNPRSDLGDLDGLAASIDAVGIIEPLVVAANGPHGYTVVAGHRRLAAARQAGLATVPCIHRGFASTAEMIECAAVENLQREGLTPLDEARAMQALVDLGRTQREIAERIGCNQSHVSRRLSLVNLPDVAAKMLVAGELQLRQAEELAELPDEDIDEVVAIVGKRRHAGDTAVADWEISSAITRITRDRKHAKAVEAGKASGLKKLKDDPRYGQRSHGFEKCKKGEATHWYCANSDQSVVWARQRADFDPAEPAGKPEWEIREERRTAAIAEREQLMRSIVANDIERARAIGMEILVERAKGHFDAEEFAGEIGVTVEQLAEIEREQPVLLLALLSFAESIHDGVGEPYQYEGTFATRARERWAQLLAGEWVAAPVRGQTDANEEFALVDAVTGDDWEGPEPLTNAATIAKAWRDEHGGRWPGAPWPGYRDTRLEVAARRIAKLDEAKVRALIAFEWEGNSGCGLRRDAILAAALGRLDELATAEA